MSLLADPKPYYETISYVWGDETLRGSVYMCGQTLDVPASAEHALRRMRHTNTIRLLWIDAVCINQSDEIERSDQVAMMNTIYGNGQRNLIWLGEDCGTTEAALTDIRKLVEEMKMETNDFKHAKEILFRGRGWRRYATTPLSTDVKHWRFLQRFYEQPWFRRLWVVQEAALSKSNVCYKGTLEFELEDVLRAAVWLRFHKASISREMASRIYQPSKIAQFTDRSCGSYHLFSGSTEETSEFITDLANFEASDPRDHVFGILGLMQRYRNGQAIPTGLIPNYRARTVEVFRDAVKSVVGESGQSIVLANISRRHKDDHMDWPSWVPRFDCFNACDDPEFLPWGLFFAHNESLQALPLHRTSDVNVLTLNGLVTDSVKKVTSALRYPGAKASEVEDIETAFIDSAFTIAGEGKNTEIAAKLIGAVASTLMASKDIRSQRLDESTSVKFYEAYICYLSASRGSFETKELSKLNVNLAKDAQEFLQAMRLVCYNRCFFSTSPGRIGVGPQTMQSGDLVAILYGSSVPFILRRSTKYSMEATHEFVGDCYVHGIMDGEAVQAHRAAGMEDEWFNLR